MQPLISKVAPFLWRTSAAAGATKRHCSSAPESSKSRNHLATFDSNLFSCRFVSDGGADVIPNLLCASAVTPHPPTPPLPAFPCPFLYITSSNKSLRSLSPVWSEENRPSSVSGGLMEKWKMRPCAHNLCQVVYFFTQPAAFSFSSPPHLQQHAQPENALIPHCHCQYKHRTCCFQGFFPHIQLPDWAANTAPHDYFISHWSRAHAHTRS